MKIVYVLNMLLNVCMVVRFRTSFISFKYAVKLIEIKPGFILEYT